MSFVHLESQGCAGGSAVHVSRVSRLESVFPYSPHHTGPNIGVWSGVGMLSYGRRGVDAAWCCHSYAKNAGVLFRTWGLRASILRL